MNFFKKFWYSVTKFERYPEMGAAGVKKAIIYFTELMLLFSIVVTIVYIYYIAKVAKYEEENLSISDKVIIQITRLYQDTEVGESIQILEEYSDSALIFTIALSVFISFYFMTMIDVLSLSIFGLLTCFIAKIKMTYKLVFNMAIYALTLSITLKAVYIGLNLIFGFKIKYFDIMYTAIAYICLAAAIFMIKSDLIKQQVELMKIIQEGKEKIEQVIPKRPKEDEEKEDEEKEDELEKNGKNDTEGQGSNA